jgi:hypothetical protein
MFRLQIGDRDTEERRQAGQTKPSPPIYACEGRQGQDYCLEAGTCQDPSRV